MVLKFDGKVIFLKTKKATLKNVALNEFDIDIGFQNG